MRPLVRQNARFTHELDFCALPCVRRCFLRTAFAHPRLPVRHKARFTHEVSFRCPARWLASPLHGMAPSVLSQKAVRPQNGAICGRERRSFHEIACYQDFTKNNGLFSTKQQNSWKFCLPRAHLREICGRSARNLNINCPAVRQEALFTHGIDFCVLPCVRTLDSRTECLSDALPGNQPVPSQNGAIRAFTKGGPSTKWRHLWPRTASPP